MSKKQMCIVLAVVVSLCCLVCLISTVISLIAAAGELPTGMIFLTLVTGCCAVMIWKGVREMD